MGKKASPISVASFLPSNVNIGNLTVREYLARLAAASAIASEVPQLTDMLRDLSDRRLLNSIASELGKAGEGDPGQMATEGIESAGRIPCSTVTGTPSLSLEQFVARAIRN